MLLLPDSFYLDLRRFLEERPQHADLLWLLLLRAGDWPSAAGALTLDARAHMVRGFVWVWMGVGVGVGVGVCRRPDPGCACPHGEECGCVGVRVWVHVCSFFYTGYLLLTYT